MPAIGAAGQWPPEVPPFRPPTPPGEPPPGPERVPPQPVPILPTWEEPEPRAWERDVAERLLEQRVVIAGGRLDQVLADRVTAQLLLLGRSAEPVELHLSCPASDLTAALGLADAVDLLAAPVHVVVRGTLRGPAVAVLCAGRHRVAHHNALFVLGVPVPSGHGTAADLGRQAEQYERQVAQLRERLTRVTGREDAEVAADLEHGRLLSADEALGYGLVEEVV